MTHITVPNGPADGHKPESMARSATLPRRPALDPNALRDRVRLAIQRGDADASAYTHRMIALRCSVTLPRDYDLARVRARIEKDAPQHDSAAGLVLLAHGVREAGTAGAGVHEYSQVSVWANTSRMGTYLWGEGGLERIRAQYGAIEVQLWPIAGLQMDRARMDAANTLELSEGTADRDSALSVLGSEAKGGAAKAIKSRDVHAAIRGLDAQTGRIWACDVRTGLSRSSDGTAFELAHLSMPPAS